MRGGAERSVSGMMQPVRFHTYNERNAEKLPEIQAVFLFF